MCVIEFSLKSCHIVTLDLIPKRVNYSQVKHQVLTLDKQAVRLSVQTQSVNLLLEIVLVIVVSWNRNFDT